MVRDVSTVIWRESIHLLRGSRSFTVILRYLAFVFIFGVIVPWESGPAWLYSPLPVIYWTWFSVYLASAATSGSFARERELNTLETLLASRLPDTAILLGKILAGVVYGSILVLASLLVGLFVLWFKAGNIQEYYSMATGLGGYFSSLLAAFAIGSLASFISLKAHTSRQAQASLSMVIILFFLPLAILHFLPEVQQNLTTYFMVMDTGFAVTIVIIILLLLDLGLWTIARRRFQRNHLIRLV